MNEQNSWERGCQLCGRVLSATSDDETICEVCFEGHDLGLNPDDAAARSQSRPDYRSAPVPDYRKLAGLPPWIPDGTKQ